MTIILSITGQCRQAKRWVFLLAGFWAAILYGQQSGTATDSLPTLTRVEQIRRLTREEAKRGYPVRLRAVVTYYTATGPRLLPLEFYSSAQPDMFIQDSTAGISVHVPPGGPTAIPGQLIEIEGITQEPDFGQEITRPRWKVIGQAPMPVAHGPLFRSHGGNGGRRPVVRGGGDRPGSGSAERILYPGCSCQGRAGCELSFQKSISLFPKGSLTPRCAFVAWAGRSSTRRIS